MTRNGGLVFQRCLDCGAARLTQRDACPSCLSPRARDERAAGEGRVISWVVYHRAYSPELAERVPYNVTLVELDEGPRMLTTVLGEDPALRCEARVRLVPSSDGRACFELE